MVNEINGAERLDIAANKVNFGARLPKANVDVKENGSLRAGVRSYPKRGGSVAGGGPAHQ